MPNYTRKGPFNNNASPSISAAVLNGIENVFIQPAGGSETGIWHFVTGCYAINMHVGVYTQSLSRGATPVSVSIDSSWGLVNIGSVGTSIISANGFLVSGTGLQALVVEAGGNFTINF